MCKELGIVQDKQLYALLMGQFVNYGLPPKDSPFVIGSGTPFTHFVDGSIYPNENTPEIIVK